MAGNSTEVSSAAYSPDLSIFSFNFPNVAKSKLHSSLFKFTNVAHNSCEKVTEPVREFIRPYQQSGNVYRWYGIADAINLSFSLCSLFYFLKHAYQGVENLLSLQEFQLSVQEFHEAEKTPEGLACAVVFTVFLVGFSTLGSFYDEKKDEPWVKNLTFYWPFFRTMCKQLKWWDKGVWAFFALLAQYKVAEQAWLIKLMFPLAVLGGLLAAMNAVWLRWMRDQRKDMVKNNLDLIEGIRAPLHQLEKLPNSLVGFENSLIWVYEPDDEKHTLYYVKYDEEDNKRVAEPIEMSETEWGEFRKKVEAKQTENIHARMKRYLAYLNKEPESFVISSQGIKLHFIADKKELEKEHIMDRILNSYIYFTQKEGLNNEERLCYVTEDGVLIPQPKSAKFHEKYQEIQQDKNVLNLTELQLQSIETLETKTPGPLYQDYEKFIRLRDEILGTEEETTKIQAQNPWVKWFAPISAGGSTIGDGLYFYFFVAKMTIATLSPAMAIFMLSSSVALFSICMLTRVAEELDFQRRLEVTIYRTQAELSKKDCIYLNDYLERLLDKKANINKADLEAIQAAVLKSRSGRERQLKLHNIKSSQPEIYEQLTLQEQTTILLCNELSDELQLSITLQKQLRIKLNRSYWAAAFEGLQNGLAIQGALASFSFMISSLCYVSAATCPPAFLLGCLILGIAAIIVSVLQALISHELYLKKVKETEKELPFAFKENVFQKTTGRGEDSPDYDGLQDAVDYVNHQSLEPPLDFVVIEWSEIFRLLFKGAVKGRNAVIEVLARFLEGSDDKWMLPYVVIAGAVAFATALGMRATAKGFAVGRPDGGITAKKGEKRPRSLFDEEKFRETVMHKNAEATSRQELSLHTGDDGDDPTWKLEDEERVTPFGWLV